MGALSPAVRRPSYDRGALERGVVHLGLGAFHRAHQAVAYDRLCEAGDLRWGVTGVSLRSPEAAEKLNPQDGLYGVAVRDGSGVEDRIVGVLGPVLVAPRETQAVIEALAAPATRLVTLTITEKGYALDAASGALMFDHPDIAADLETPESPRTAVGLIVAGLAQRRARGLAPVTVLSCDNLTDNGPKLAAAVVALAGRLDGGLADWIGAKVAFPASMVDRIVPATEPEDIATAEARTGLRDEGLVKTEPFFQWVVEDRFSSEAPDLASVGVQMTGDVRPWETAKLRMLNGAHSAMAYLGGLAGLTYVHEVAATTGGRALVERLWDEQHTTLTPGSGINVAAYRAELMRRFANPALAHRLSQIAMDGSQKLPPRLFAPMLTRLRTGAAIDGQALAVAAWVRWLGGRDDDGRATPLDDPRADALRGVLNGVREPREQVLAVATLDGLVPPELARDERFIATTAGLVERLATAGARSFLG